MRGMEDELVGGYLHRGSMVGWNCGLRVVVDRGSGYDVFVYRSKFT